MAFTPSGAPSTNVINNNPVSSFSGISKVTLATAGDREEVVIPVGTIRFMIVWSKKASVKVFETNSSVEDFPIPSGNAWKEDNLNLTQPVSLFFESNKDGTVVSIMTWT